MRWVMPRHGGNSGRNRLRTGAWTRRLTLLAGFTLLPGLLTPVVFAADVPPGGAPKLPAPHSARVSPFTPRVNKKTAAAMKKAADAHRTDAARAKADQARTVTWPTAGTTTVTLPTSGRESAAPGALPLTLSAVSSSATGKHSQASGQVQVTVLDRRHTAQLGVKGIALTVTGPATGGSAQFGINYVKFASAYGGDWAGRLQVQQLPSCALSDPLKARCRSRTPLASINDRKHNRIQADLAFASTAASDTASTSASGPTVLLALAAGTESGAGDYKATPLASSSTWEAGGSAGTLTWSYPLRTPPAAAGPQPDLSISYDSGSVDGQTASTNNQGTAIGTGFDITSSYIERKYASCDDDGQDEKYDLCWKYDNATIVLNGSATELVKDDTSGEWRLKSDDASTVTHSTGADNDDDNGEYWTITTGNGIKYVFGLNKLNGAPATDRTESVWTVPVFGDDPGEPGYADGSTFSDRDKKQAWRWNLDYVEDLHGNASTYWYDAEPNNYDKLGDDNTGTPYIRGGQLKEIRYGQRATALFSGSPAASNKVTFTYEERCLATGTGCDSLTEDTRDNWPDVPYDAVCKDATKCTGNTGPSFFTRKRMTAISTYAWNAAAAVPDYAAVDTWALKQQYLDPGDTGDSSDQSLWLDEIRHTGKHGTELTLPPVSFGHEFLANRVDGTDNILPLNKPRLSTITSETGAQTVATYLPADCSAGQTKPALDTNTKRCYPVYWSPNGENTPVLDWFQKYPVSAISTTDPLGGSEAVEHTYTYSGGGAWHYNEDPFTKEKERTWSSWRGYGQVTHIIGRPDRTQSKSVTVYLRGMNGDRVLGPDGKTPDASKRKTVTVTGIKAPEITDAEQYAGFTRESATYNGPEETGGQINDPWSKKTATQHKSYADTEAYYVRTATTHTRTNITTSGTPHDRVRTTATTFDDYGMPETTEDKGDTAATGDEKCTHTWYARNDDLGINNLVTRTRTVAQPCTISDATLDLPADSAHPGDVISDTATAYDTTNWSTTQKPTQGEAHWAGRAQSYGTDNQPTWQTTETTTFDTLGRALTVKNTDDTPIATTTYTPADTGPLTETTVSNAKSHLTKTRLDFATGAPLKVTDPNNKSTESTYDSLGRVTQTWLPNRLRSGGQSPSYVYDYSVTQTGLPWVSTGTLKGTGGYNTTFEIYDSLLRPRQTQSPSPLGGRLIALTLYDDRGQAASSQSDIWDVTTTPTSTIVQTEGSQAPLQTDTTYDGAGRTTKTVTMNFGVTRWSTEATYTGDTVATTAPAGGQATAVVTDALGQTTQRREYASTQPTGNDFTATNFTYYPAGQQATVTGPDQAIWTYAYDLFGRQTGTTDPDTGTSTKAYDALDQVIATTDSRGKTLVSEYDLLGRQTGLWDDTKTDANQLAAWTFDTLAKGQPDASTRYDGGLNGKAYTSKVTAYTSLYQVAGSRLTLPADDPLVTAGVPTTLNFSTLYNFDGTVKQTSHPAVAGLPAETVQATYNDLGQQITAKSGTSGYLQAALYSELGDLNQLTLAKSPNVGKSLYLTSRYEPGTRRLENTYASDDIHAGRLQDLNYTQDDAGNVTSIFDAGTQGGTTETDNQCFTYDGNRRLTEAWTPRTADCAASGRATANLDGAAPYWTSYTYTDAGQRKTETQHATSGDSTTNYSYGTTASQPHPLAETTGAKAATYGYDQAGNTTSRPGTQAQQTLAWNAQGQLVSATEPATSTKAAIGTNYLYDAAGQLLISRNTIGDGDTVLYLGDNEIRLTTKGSTKTLTGTRYYTAAGQTIAIRTATVGTAGSQLNFVAGDHHGTATLAVDAATLAVTKRYTTPFGASRGTNPITWPDDKAFLGKPADIATGLTHVDAREYDPSIGQFISIDPVLSLEQPQSLNGYSYANNSPVTSSDPTGTVAMANRSGGWDEDDDEEKPTGGGNDDGGTANVGSWQTEGATAEDYDHDGYIYVYPGVKINAMQDKAEAFINYFYDEIRSLCYKHDHLSCYTDTGWLPARETTALAALDACHVTKCPSKKTLFYDYASSAVGLGISEGVGRPKGSSKNSKVNCNQCFLAGTDVLMADGSTEDIEDIRVGEKVEATDPDTGESGPRKVTSLIVTEDDKHFNTLSIATKDGIEELTATFEHPFWSPSERRWVAASNLEAGVTLLTDDGSAAVVTGNHAFTKHARTYNLAVEGLHTYYVLAGATAILVHNCDRAYLDFTDAERQKVYDANAAKNGGLYKCDYCGRTVERRGSRDANGNAIKGRPDDAQVDHVVPRASGGHGGEHNGAVACRRCNRDKSTKTLEDWDNELREFLDE